MLTALQRMRESHALRRFERRIPAYLHGVLPDRRRRWFERTLLESEACRLELRAYRSLHDVLSATPVEYPDQAAWRDFVPLLRDHLRREADVGARPLLKRPGPVRSAFVYAAYGAIFGLALGSVALTSGWRLGVVARSVAAAPSDARASVVSPAAVDDLASDMPLTIRAALLGLAGDEPDSAERPPTAHAQLAAVWLDVRVPTEDVLRDVMAPVELYHDGDRQVDRYQVGDVFTVSVSSGSRP